MTDNDVCLSPLSSHLQEWLQNTVALCATLHDIADWKYCESETAGITALRNFLDKQQAPDTVCDSVEYVITRIGFKESLKSCETDDSGAYVAQTNRTNGPATQKDALTDQASWCSCPGITSDDFDPQTETTQHEADPVDSAFLGGPPPSTNELALRIVQDADRLDALGALSYLACISFTS